MTDGKDSAATVAGLVDRATICMFTTMTPDGQHVARPMAVQEVEFDGDLWFFAYAESEKVGEIGANPQVNVSFSNSYYFVNQAVVANAGTPISRVKTVAGLRPYKLGAQVGTTSYSYITRFIRPSQTPSVYDSNNDAISALKAGQIDGIVVDLPTAFYVVAVQLDNGKIVGKLPQRGPRERFGMVFEKGNPLVRCVNRALNRLWANGTIKALQRTYLARAGAPDLK